MVRLVYCMKCKVKKELRNEVSKVYTTSRGIKYGVVGVCDQGHKLSAMIKNPQKPQ